MRLLDRILAWGATRMAPHLVSALPDPRSTAPDTGTQRLLQLRYRELAATPDRLPNLQETGFKAFSQTDEDGILLYLFALLGERTRMSVEICAGNGVECNTANLIIHHGWHGLLVDGNPANIEHGRAFYAKHPATYVYSPKLLHAWITRDKVNDLVREAGFEGEIDLLSIDMDGVDYWIWDALEVVRPRVVVVEYQDILGPERACTVPYSDDFNAKQHSTTRGLPNFCGASLAAFVKLGRRKGYRLVGCNRLGFNAFFVRDPEALALLPEQPAQGFFRHPKVLEGLRERFPLIQHAPWKDV